MTAGTFTVVCGLVLHLVTVQKISVTGKAKLPQHHGFSTGNRRWIMALLTFAFTEWRMNGIWRRLGRDRFGGGHRCFHRGVIGRSDAGWMIGDSRFGRHSVKKERQPLALGGGTASGC